MRINATRSRLRLAGLLACLAAAGLYLATWLAFDHHWLAITLTGMVGWLTAGAYAAVGLATVGILLVVATAIPRRAGLD